MSHSTISKNKEEGEERKKERLGSLNREEYTSDATAQKKDGCFLRPQPVVTAAGVSDGEESDGSILSLSSLTSMASERSRKRKGQSSSNAGNQPASKRALYLKKKKSDEDENGDEDIDPLMSPTKSRKSKVPSVESLGQEMQERPTGDLAAFIREQLVEVENVANKSRNIKGSFVYTLRVAARTIEAATAEIAQRTATDANVERLERENAQMRQKMTEINSKMDRLTEELNAIRCQDTRTGTLQLASHHSAIGGVVWEEKFMQRIDALMDRKLKSFQLTVPKDAANLSTQGLTSKGTKGKGQKKTNQLQNDHVSLQPASSTAVPAGTPQLPGPITKWTTVLGKKAKSKPAAENTKASRPQPKKKAKVGKAKVARLPKTAAITVTVPKGSEMSYAMVMTAAKERIKPSECGVEAVRPKRAITGALILEVSGVDCAIKADALASRMRETLADLDVHIGRPTKMGEIRVRDLDEAVTSQEVAEAVAKAAGCTLPEVKIGTIRRSTNTLGTVWVRCPLAAVKKLAAAKHILIGWVSARIEILAARPLQCFRCLETGHVRNMCPSAIDRSMRCYACGESDHLASQCSRPLNCPLCSDLGQPADHRMGSKKCSPPKSKSGRKAVSHTARPDAAQVPITNQTLERSARDPTEEAMEAS